jgi:CRP-like cAMP-binding protein
VPNQHVARTRAVAGVSNPALRPMPPALTRLAALAPLDDMDVAVLHKAAANVRRVSARRELIGQGQPVAGASLLLSGWACRVSNLSDGRRQIVSLILPGDLIGTCGQRNPVAASTILALTEVATMPAPKPRGDQNGTGLTEAYALSMAWDEAYLLRNITRLGRLSAYERTADLLLELHERLSLAGLARGNTFPMPLTQQTLADTLGLTTVHVNRTLQALRQDGSVTIGGGTVELHDPRRLTAAVDRRPVQVQIAQALS